MKQSRERGCIVDFIEITFCINIYNKYQVSLMNPRDTLHYGNVLQTKVDAQSDKLATELSHIVVTSESRQF